MKPLLGTLAAVAVMGAFGAATPANALSFYQNYLVRPAFDVSSIVLYQRGPDYGGTTNSFDAYAPETLITDPFLKTKAIDGTYFLGVSDLGTGGSETPEEHLVLALDNAFAAGLISGGLDFTAIFTGYSEQTSQGYTEAALIGALRTLSTGGHTEEEINAASSYIFDFSDDLADMGGLFGGVDTFSLVSFSSAAAFGDGESFQTAVPEPAAWALMILGFGGTGAVFRRRRQRDTFAAA